MAVGAVVKVELVEDAGDVGAGGVFADEVGLGADCRSARPTAGITTSSAHLRVSKLRSRRGSVLVDEAAEQIEAFDVLVGRSVGCVSRVGRGERERAVREGFQNSGSVGRIGAVALV
jgi:hypothetical protein